MYVLLDGSTISTREELHDALLDILPLPPWYGRNLDALYDSLGDIRRRVDIHLRGVDALQEHLGGYAGAFLEVLTRSAEENPRLTLTLDDDE